MIGGFNRDDAVKAYVDRGWPLFPVHWERKAPLIQRGFHAATLDGEQIAAWAPRWPKFRVGIATGRPSGLVVLDIDTKNDRSNGYDTLEELGRSILPDTPLAHTPSGGLHVYFTAIGTEIRNSVGKHGLGPGLDVRGDGGYIIAPSEGSGYSWDPHWNLNTVSLFPAPAWLGHRQHHRSKRRNTRLDPHQVLATACENICRAGSGERHDVLNREAFLVGCVVASGALTEAEARHALTAATTAMTWRTQGNDRKAGIDLEAAFADGLAKGDGRRRWLRSK